MLITKTKAKNGTIFYNFIFNKADLKECKNTKFVKLGLKSDYLVGLSNKQAVKLQDLNFNEIEVESK